MYTMGGVEENKTLEKHGDIGFKNLAKFNETLLAQQAWRLLWNPQTLLARLMKARTLLF